VTFAFTDIEGSTRLLQQLGEDGYAVLLDRHRQIVRGAFYAADGIEVDRQGDACFFALPRANDAVRAAVEIQNKHESGEWPEKVIVRVRIGLHTGEPSVERDGYVGVDVVKGARICSAARGGQVIMSASTHALTIARLPTNVTCTPLEPRQLKDIDQPELLYVLVRCDANPISEPRLPKGWERRIEERFGRVGVGIARTISNSIGGSAEASSAAHQASPDRQRVRGHKLERLAGRALKMLEANLHP
jgi:class 3 adenylate cyclase